MNIQEFNEKFNKIASENSYLNSNFEDFGNTLKWEWITGGVTGGNCWGEGGHCSRDSESEPDETPLDKFLANNFASMTFFHYKKIIGVVEKRDRSEYEYYGNSTNYCQKYITMSKLQDILLTLGYLD